MTPADLGQVVEGVTEAVAEHVGEVSKALDAALKRIADLEERWLHSSIVRATPPENAFQIAVRHGFVGDEVAWLASLRAKDAEPVDLQALAMKAAELVPRPKDGNDGRNGQDAELDMEAMHALVTAQVTRQLAEWPRPQDGKSVTMDDLVPLVQSEVAKAVAALPAPKDPVGLVGAFIERDGSLVVTMSDGSTRSVGCVVGRDGKDGTDADMVAIHKQVADAIAAIPVPKDGKDGRDGLGFEDLKAEYDDAGRLFLVFERSGIVPLRIWVPGLVYRGVFQDGVAYKKADCCTRDGSVWIAHEDTRDKPGDGKTSWQLAVKKGTEGKRGLTGEKGEPGKDGKDGIDLNRRGY